MLALAGVVWSIGWRMTDAATLTAGRELPLARAWGWAMAICVTFFVAVAPTLSWLEFSGGSENLNVATVLEMHRGGPWLVPTLKDKPRLAKPPLTAWTSAAFVSPATVRLLDSTDARVRDEAYRQLAWEIRWPALVLCCITLLGVFEMTRVLVGARGGAEAGLVAMVFFAGALMTLRFGRAATTDVQLMTWVTWAIVGLLHAVVRGRWWTGCAVAGVCLGLAFMAKGPVAFVQAVAPVVVARVMLMGTGLPRVKVLPAVMCVILTAAIGLPWYMLQFHQHGWAVMELWKVEVTREGATDLARDPVWSYLSFFLLMLPWAPLLVMGLVAGVGAWQKKSGEMRSLVMLGCLVLVPLVIMTCFKDKNERYTLPVTAAACALMAAVTLPVLRGAAGGWRKVVVDVTFALPVGVAIVLAVCGALGGEVGRVLTLLRADGQPWHSPLVAVLAATAALAVTLLGHTMRGDTVLARPLAGFVAMLIAGALFVHGYSRDERGVAEFRTTAFHLRDTYGARPLYSMQNPADRIFHDLNIYLNRVVREVKTIEEVPADALLLQIRRTSANAFVPPPGWEMLETRVAGKRAVYIARRVGS